MAAPPARPPPDAVTGGNPSPASAMPAPRAASAATSGPTGRRSSGAAPVTVAPAGVRVAAAARNRMVVPDSRASSGRAGLASRPPAPVTVQTVGLGRTRAGSSGRPSQVDPGAQLGQGGGHGVGVVAAGGAVQVAGALGQGGAEQGPVGDALAGRGGQAQRHRAGREELEGGREPAGGDRGPRGGPGGSGGTVDRGGPAVERYPPPQPPQAGAVVSTREGLASS